MLGPLINIQIIPIIDSPLYIETYDIRDSFNFVCLAPGEIQH